MRAGSLFSGVGGLDLGLHRAGFEHAFFCESDPWRRDVLRAHWPGVPVHEDVRDVASGAREHRREGLRLAGSTGADEEPAEGGTVHLLCGGFPCQDLSVAGNRAGLAGARSGLFHEFARIIDLVRPRWLLVENVPGLLSSNGGRDFGIVVGTLAELGYGVGWRVLDSRFFGVPQRRRRVFIVGTVANGDPRAASVRAGQILAVGSRCPGHPATRREAREDVAGTLGGGAGERGWAQDTEGMTFVSAQEACRDDGNARAEVRRSSFASPADSHHSDPERDRVSDGAPTSQGTERDGGGFRGASPAVAAPLSHGSNPNSNMAGRRREDDFNLVAGPLGGGNDGAGRRSEDDPNLVYPLARRGRDGGSELEVGEPGVYNALRGGDGGSSRLNQIMVGAGVRRLTPVECERLQNWPDQWTNPNGDAPDSRRYAACGDGVTASVSEWIGRRILQSTAEVPA